MHLSHLLAFILSLALAPCLTSAAIFPKDTLVKSIDAKSFRKVMRENQTSLVAFVAPWCGHCQNMAPEYSRAAKSLSPLIPLYAVDCDAQENKQLCSEQGVQGFPTVKLFPRGNQAPPTPYNGERKAGAFISFASRSVPHGIKRLKVLDDIKTWAAKTTDKPRVLLLNKKEKAPLIWQVLSNKFKHRMPFGNHHDLNGATSEALGFEKGADNQNKILVFPVGSDEPIKYDGSMKAEVLSKYFRAVIKGEIDLTPKKKPETAQEPEGDSRDEL